MRLVSRLRSSQLAGAAGLFGAALLLAPPPADADRDDWDDRGHHGHYERGPRHHRHHHEHGEWCAPRRAPRYAYYDGPVWYGPPPRAHHARYYCEPCSHWYDDEESFHYHVYHHHHVPPGVLPLVIMATVFGAVFGGY